MFGGSPLFSVAFAYQNTPQPGLALPGIAIEVADPAPVAPKFPLTVTVGAVHPAGGEQQVLAEFDGRVLHADTVAGLLQRYLRLLELAAARPDAPCGDLMRAATVPGPRTPIDEAAPDPDPAAEHRTLAGVLAATVAERPDSIGDRKSVV